MTSDNAAHALMQGLIYPAFLGTFIVSFVASSLNGLLGLGGILKVIFLFILFGFLYLETYFCHADQYEMRLLLLDIAEIAVMTANFALVGLFKVTLLEDHRQYLSTPLFEWSGFFLMNVLLIWISEYYRSRFIGRDTYASAMLAFAKFFFLACFLLSLFLLVRWSVLLSWISYLFALSGNFIGEKISEFLPFADLGMSFATTHELTRYHDALGAVLALSALNSAAESLLVVLVVVSIGVIVLAYGLSARAPTPPESRPS